MSSHMSRIVKKRGILQTLIVTSIGRQRKETCVFIPPYTEYLVDCSGLSEFWSLMIGGEPQSIPDDGSGVIQYAGYRSSNLGRG